MLTWVPRFSSLSINRSSTLSHGRTDHPGRKHGHQTTPSPLLWQNIPPVKVLNIAGFSTSAQGHYKRILHELHWTIRHIFWKRAKADGERKTLIRYQLCASDAPPGTTISFGPTSILVWSKPDMTSTKAWIPLASTIDYYPFYFNYLSPKMDTGFVLGGHATDTLSA